MRALSLRIAATSLDCPTKLTKRMDRDRVLGKSLYGQIVLYSETGRIRFRESTVSSTELSESFGPHRVQGRELSEFLSAYYLCAKANSPSSSQNSPSSSQNSVSSLLRNSTLEIVFRPFPVYSTKALVMIEARFALSWGVSSSAPKRPFCSHLTCHSQHLTCSFCFCDMSQSSVCAPSNPVWGQA